VDSLPEQHIDSLPEPKRDEAYVQVGMICAFRSQGLSEDKVAYKAKFRSTNDMYFRLERWGLYGLLPLREDPQKVASEGEELPSAANAVPVGKRKAKKFGEKTPLPPAAGAVDQFRQTLEVLIKDLEKLREIGQEYLQSERFLEVAGGDAADIQSRSARDADTALQVLVRAYNQATEPALQSRCLDLFDRMAELGIYQVIGALERYER
jgi:hypothetical protein